VSQERKAVAFLNSPEGGVFYFGVDDDGSVFGIDNVDQIQLQITDRLKNNILPNTLGLFDLVAEEYDERIVLRLTVSSGMEKPYYLSEYGMSPKGCYLRIGSSAQPMTTQMIDTLYAKRFYPRLSSIPSPRQRLTFNTLKLYYSGKGLELNDEFAYSLDLIGKDGNFNYAAYLLADDNGISIKVAKYADDNKVDLIENEEYGYCCLIKAADRVLEKLTVEKSHPWLKSFLTGSPSLLMAVCLRGLAGRTSSTGVPCRATVNSCAFSRMSVWLSILDPAWAEYSKPMTRRSFSSRMNF
jgi:hypothetical protein